jgi:hypothetical protein
VRLRVLFWFPRGAAWQALRVGLPHSSSRRSPPNASPPSNRPQQKAWNVASSATRLRHRNMSRPPRAAGLPTVAPRPAARIASRSAPSSLLTLCWRKADSNSRSHRERNGREKAPGDLAISDLNFKWLRLPGDVPIGSARQSLSQQRDRWFESALLQRRVLCEPDFVDEASATRWRSGSRHKGSSNRRPEDAGRRQCASLDLVGVHCPLAAGSGL